MSDWDIDRTPAVTQNVGALSGLEDELRELRKVIEFWAERIALFATTGSAVTAAEYRAEKESGAS